MFEVECPSCRAGYKVDERRIPPGGLKMRCPKCGESFEVAGPGLSEPPVLGGALGLRAAAPAPAPAPPPERRAATKQTMIGVAPHHSLLPGAPAKAQGGLELATLDDEAVASADDLEMDLPSPAPELPWPVQAPPPARRGVEPPSSKKPKSKAPGLEIDLPGVLGDSAAGLPQVQLSGRDGDEFDLPQLGGELPELPELPEAALPSLGGAGLPGLVGAGLPSAAGAGLPRAAGPGLPKLAGAGLPSPAGPGLPKRAGPGLPTPAQNLPAMGGSLPSLVLDAANFADGGDISLESVPPSPNGGFILSQAPSGRESARPAQPFRDPFGEGPTTGPESAPPFGEASVFDDADVVAADDESGEFDAFPTESGPAPGHGSGAGGYGDVALDEGSGLGLGGAVGLGADMDRGPALPGPAAAASAQVELPRPDATPLKVRTPKTSLSRGARVAIAGVLLLAVAGGAIGAFLPEVGPYGAYAILDLVRADRYRADLETDIAQAQLEIDRDTAPGAKAAFRLLDGPRSQAPRFKARAAYAAYAGLLGQMRFGSSELGAPGNVLVDGMSLLEPADVPYLQLARVARAAASGDRSAALAPGFAAQGLPQALLAGEAALLSADGKAALEAFEAAMARAKSPRVLFGLARATRLLGQRDASKSWADATLAANPAHLGAKLLLAELDVAARKKDSELVGLLEPIAKGEGGASSRERAEALILLGDLHLGRGRLNDAESAFTKALTLEPGSASAQRGLADALFEAGRFSEAQTRYDAAMKTDPASLAAGLGLVRCRIRLEELDSARTLLAELQKGHADSTSLQYWAGQVAEQSGDRPVAAAAYQLAIKLDQSGPELVSAYIGLTRLLGQEGKTEAADITIAEAERRFPDDPLIYEALAELSSARGSFDSAIADYDRALALDSGNLGLQFAKAIALRKAQRYDEAARTFELVEQQSKDYPGLALERANLLEASGKEQEALALYEKALQEAPDSLDMMLRVGCARAQAKQGEKALEVLRKVESDRPNSAEVNFCLGLAHLHRNGGLPDARRYLQRSVAFDASRANYHLYVAWVAIDMADYALADASLGRALELDQTLADAYWKRGELRVKQGAVDDAVRDLKRALELTPTRFEAHAQLGLAYLQNGKEPEALEEFRRATEQPGVPPYFNYRYGELLLANRRAPEAQKQLSIAVELGQKDTPAPPWLWDAHRLLAMALGRKKEALDHWKAFADHAPNSSPYLSEAVREMNAIMASLGR
jgi:predicted Zn finger-like uncharacterized protein